MRDAKAILDNKDNTGGISGYTLHIYAYSNSYPYYTGSPLYTYIDNGDGTYYTDITLTIKGTIVITTPTGAILVPKNWIGALFKGDNQLTLEPTSTTPTPTAPGAVFDEEVYDGGIFG